MNTALNVKANFFIIMFSINCDFSTRQTKIYDFVEVLLISVLSRIIIL